MSKTKEVNVGSVGIGGNNPISVQSMLNTNTADYNATIAQIKQLADAGCDIVRLAVENAEQANVVKKLVKNTNIPLVADIQYDYKLAIICCDIGIAKVRFNPGNIGSETKVTELVTAAKRNNTPIRIGVNGGSLDKNMLTKYGHSALALAESALHHAHLLEKNGFDKIILSVKASDIHTTVHANRILASKCNYPLHIGITESGGGLDGQIKSSIGIGALLLDGIGNTIRVSLSSPPVQEVYAAKQILKALDLLKNQITVVSCPTCSRCKFNLFSLAQQVRDIAANKTASKPVKIAVMGCAVNGIGEAGNADFGIAGGDGKSVLFKNGKIIKTDSTELVINEFLQMVKAIE